jgi:hypothetical protein
MANKFKDESGTQPEGTASGEANDPAERVATQMPDSSGKRPLWTRKINRVQAAIWSHVYKDKTFFSVSLYREYTDKRNNETKKTSSFDRSDLQDVAAMVSEARHELVRLSDMAQAAVEA